MTIVADQLECLQVWTRALQSQVLALAGESSVLAVAVCDCLSAMSPAAYEHLSVRIHYSLVLYVLFTITELISTTILLTECL